MILVWKPFVRVFHLLLIIAILSNLFLNEEGEFAHIWIGYGSAALVIARIFYGFFADDAYASWKEITQTLFSIKNLPANLWEHLKGKAPRTLTHPPQAFLWMMILFFVILLMGISGFLLTTDQYSDHELVQDIHEIGSNALKVLIVIHLLGVLKSSYDHKQNLVASMIHGKKKS